jgi:serine/threonine-protein kinase RsbW
MTKPPKKPGWGRSAVGKVSSGGTLKHPEILANIVEHGSAGRHLVQIEMQVSVAADRVDDGNPHTGDLNAASMPDHFAERGRGIAIAKSALADLTYRREGQWHIWRLASRTY